MRAPVGGLALLCAAAVAAAGCGGNSSNDFRKEYNKVVRQYSALPSDVNRGVNTASGKSDKALAARFASLADRTESEVAKLRKLDPPDKAKDEYDTFLASIGRIADDLRAISGAAKAHDAAKAQTSARALVRDAAKTSGAEAALKKAVD